jgi:hypothetical protein
VQQTSCDKWGAPAIGPWSYCNRTEKSGKKNLRIYPLAQAKGPPETKFISASGVELNTVHANDFSYFEELNQIVQEEPSEALDPERLGLFASIGIEKGKPFAPKAKARMKKILTEAAAVGNATARVILFRTRSKEAPFYPASAWITTFVGGSYEFLSQPDVRNLDARTLFFYYATGGPVNHSLGGFDLFRNANSALRRHSLATSRRVTFDKRTHFWTDYKDRDYSAWAHRQIRNGLPFHSLAPEVGVCNSPSPCIRSGLLPCHWFPTFWILCRRFHRWGKLGQTRHGMEAIDGDSILSVKTVIGAILNGSSIEQTQALHSQIKTLFADLVGSPHTHCIFSVLGQLDRFIERKVSPDGQGTNIQLWENATTQALKNAKIGNGREIVRQPADGKGFKFSILVSSLLKARTSLMTP